MSIALPLIGVFLAAVAAYLSTREAAEPFAGPRLIGVALLLLIGIAAAMRYEPELDRTWTIVGIAVGVVVCVVAGLRPGAAAAIGIAGAAALHLLPVYGVAPAQTAMLAAVGLSAIIAGTHAAAVGAAVVLVLDRFGALNGGGEGLTTAGSMIGVALVAGAVVVMLIPASQKWRSGVLFLAPLLAVAFLNAAAKDQQLALIGIGGLVSAGVLYLLFSESRSPLGIGIGSIISIGLATAAFALGRGMGMATALAVAAGVLLLSNRPQAVLALGPLFALTLFRLFRNLYPETSRAFDIGQHYALIGLMIGAILPLILIDAGAISLRTRNGSFALPVLALVSMALAPLLTIFFGPIGTVGFVVGLGFAATFELVRQGSSLQAISSACGVAGAVLLSYGWLSKALELSRDEKIKVLTYAIVGIAIAAGAFALLTRGEKREA